MWAVEIASSNIDAYSSLANNYFLYHPADGEPWVMLPWGPDQSFLKDKPPEVEVGVYDSPHGRLARDCRGDPACSAALDLALAEVLDLWEEIDLAAAVDHTTTRIEAACRADTRSNYGDYGCRDAQIAMRAWVRARPDIVRAALLAGPTP